MKNGFVPWGRMRRRTRCFVRVLSGLAHLHPFPMCQSRPCVSPEHSHEYLDCELAWPPARGAGELVGSTHIMHEFHAAESGTPAVELAEAIGSVVNRPSR